jgi:hypothetical protein
MNVAIALSTYRNLSRAWVYHPRALAVAAQSENHVARVLFDRRRHGAHRAPQSLDQRAVASSVRRPRRARQGDVRRARFGTRLHRGHPGARTLWRFARREIEIHPTEAEGYFLNVSSETPVVFVMWRMRDDGVVPPAEPFIVTLSYNEAGRFMDGGERVDPVPMSATIRDWLAAYVAVHYKPEPKKKVKRNDPFRDGAFRRGS